MSNWLLILVCIFFNSHIVVFISRNSAFLSFSSGSWSLARCGRFTHGLLEASCPGYESLVGNVSPPTLLMTPFGKRVFCLNGVQFIFSFYGLFFSCLIQKVFACCKVKRCFPLCASRSPLIWGFMFWSVIHLTLNFACGGRQGLRVMPICSPFCHHWWVFCGRCVAVANQLKLSGTHVCGSIVDSCVPLMCLGFHGF